MPLRLSTPLLTVDAGKMHQIDTSNVENLFSMWTVFNRCAESMEEGRRLENLSWRLWNRETFCCDSKPKFPDTPTSSTSQARTPKPMSKKQTPDLSASVDSINSVESEEVLSSTSPPVHIKQSLSDKSLTESFSSSRSRCKPISSYTLEKMVVEIKNTKINDLEDLSALSTSLTDAFPTVSIRLNTPPPAQNQQPAPSKPRQSEQRASQSSVSTAPIPSPTSTVERSQTMESDTSAELMQSHSVVRGFAPSKISSSQRSSTSLAAGRSPVPVKSVLRNSAMSSHNSLAANKGNFMLGGSSDDESSFDDTKSLRPSSSLTAGLKRPQQLQQQHTPKMTTFREEVEIRGDQADEAAIDSDDSDADSDLSESAIEEEDDGWEDDLDNQSDRDQGLFQRVSSKPNLVSRRSLLTTGLHESERAAALTAQANHSQPVQPQQQGQPQPKSKLQVKITEPTQLSGISRSKPMAMPVSAPQAHYALSPRTTRRNMLSTELTESLRQNLLWERQFKNTTAQAFLKRRHTTHDNLDKIKQLPTPDSETPSRKTSWDNVFNLNNEYNTRGW